MRSGRVTHSSKVLYKPANFVFNDTRESFCAGLSTTQILLTQHGRIHNRRQGLPYGRGREQQWFVSAQRLDFVYRAYRKNQLHETKATEIDVSSTTHFFMGMDSFGGGFSQDDILF
jgi:hypothetical protein